LARLTKTEDRLRQRTRIVLTGRGSGDAGDRAGGVFVERYNQTAHPFAWTKSEVHQNRLKPRFADL